MNLLTTILNQTTIHHYLLLCSVLFSIGVLGVILRRNFIMIFMSIELMLNSVNLLLAAFSRFNGNQNGQVFVFFIMVVAAAEVAVGLGILVMIYRNIRSTDINTLKNLKW